MLPETDGFIRMYESKDDVEALSLDILRGVMDDPAKINMVRELCDYFKVKEYLNTHNPDQLILIPTARALLAEWYRTNSL